MLNIYIVMMLQIYPLKPRVPGWVHLAELVVTGRLGYQHLQLARLCLLGYRSNVYMDEIKQMLVIGWHSLGTNTIAYLGNG